jgi:hypothetical protein
LHIPALYLQIENIKKVDMEIIGTIQKKLEKQSGQSDKGSWTKQDFILETMEKFPRKVCVTNWKEKVALEDIQEGDLLKVFVNLESREHHGRWYTDLKAWRLEKIKSQEVGSEETQKGSVLQQGNQNIPF